MVIFNILGTNCNAPGEGTNTAPVVSSAPYSPGQSYIYTCNSGYTAGDYLEITCKIDGTWSLDPPTCIGKNSLLASWQKRVLLWGQ